MDFLKGLKINKVIIDKVIIDKIIKSINGEY